MSSFALLLVVALLTVCFFLHEKRIQKLEQQLWLQRMDEDKHKHE